MRNYQETPIHSVIRPGAPMIEKFDLRKYEQEVQKRGVGIYDALEKDMAKLGYHIQKEDMVEMQEAYSRVRSRARRTSAMDDLQPMVTTPSVTTPVQFLQNWLPGFVRTITAARKIDDFIGLLISGSWEDEQVVQGILELTGAPVPYQDDTNVPFSSWNTNFSFNTVTRWELGLRVGRLETERAARMNLDTAASKRASVLLQLEIIRNLIGFYGYNNGVNNTFGFLNAPLLPAYVNVPNGTSGFPQWSTKTFLEIVSDILTAIVQLRTQSQGNIDPKKVATTLGLPTDAVDRLSTTTDFGYSVYDWLRDNYPLIRVEDAVQLDNANGGANVFYLWADRIADDSTDGGQTFQQNVQSKYKVLGVQQQTKGFEEDYASATAGVMLKRPWAVVRYSGI